MKASRQDPALVRRSSGKAGAGRDPDAEVLAHELNSLLDGSIRSVDLARRALRDAGTPAGVEQRLDAARAAMWQMAELLQQALRGPGTAGEMALFQSPRTLAEEIAWQVDPLREVMAARGIRMTVNVMPEAGELPAGPLGAVVRNGLHNAMQAMETASQAQGDVCLTAAITRGGDLLVRLTDTGPGLGSGVNGTVHDHGGHGIGLALSRRIVEGLGGTLLLMDASPGPGPGPGAGPGAGAGATLEIRIPMRSMRAT